MQHRAILEKLRVPVKKFPALYWTWWLITAVASSRHLLRFLARWFQSATSHHISFKIHFNIILLSTLRFSGRFTFTRQTPARNVSSPHICYMPCPIHHSDSVSLITYEKQMRLCSSKLCSFYQPRLTCSLLGLSNPHSLLLNTLGVCCFLDMCYHFKWGWQKG